MAEIGKVIGTEKNKLVVRMTRKEACAKCRACYAGLKEQDMLLKAVNLCNAKVGDRVEVMLETADFMKATCIMYGIPCAMFIIGILAGYYGFEALGKSGGEFAGFGLGIVLVVLTYLIIRTQEKRFKNGNYVPKAIKVVE